MLALSGGALLFVGFLGSGPFDFFAEIEPVGGNPFVESFVEFFVVDVEAGVGGSSLYRENLGLAFLAILGMELVGDDKQSSGETITAWKAHRERLESSKRELSVVRIILDMYKEMTATQANKCFLPFQRTLLPRSYQIY